MKTIERRVSATLEGTPYATQLRTRDLEWTADEPPDHGGANAGASPHEMVLGGLAACTAITLRMYADRKGWEVGRIDVYASLQRRQEGSGVESDILLDLAFGGNPDEAQRARLLQIAKACPVHRTLAGTLRMEATIGGEKG